MIYILQNVYYIFFAGRKYDKNGNAVQWWTQKTIDKYELLAQCFVDQYNGYLVPGLEENIHVRIKVIAFSRDHIPNLSNVFNVFFQIFFTIIVSMPEWYLL